MQLRKVLIENVLLFEILSHLNVACLFIILYFWQSKLRWPVSRPAQMMITLCALLYFYAYANVPRCLSRKVSTTLGEKKHPLTQTAKTAYAAREYCGGATFWVTVGQTPPRKET